MQMICCLTASRGLSSAAVESFSSKHIGSTLFQTALVWETRIDSLQSFIGIWSILRVGRAIHESYVSLIMYSFPWSLSREQRGHLLPTMKGYFTMSIDAYDSIAQIPDPYDQNIIIEPSTASLE
ncbi:hypothetical protein BO94DRAFT_20915 [Aspergillus sclerotioniger CBS 115572]|uniref:Uncharacterized protein n=1 Tax=Aspergillus sclerotioniger CBS 115572 TaxID=1450535 RepID=A0A317X148_9EURO|nr:hypothetical protein BO94DRAFT_20915 [Aspergillus sclerotioniger CBS 115572]PWY90250.1 hypothetical protein BO94DRAFT_20915 [Aspergillus sclerotioniger CBS 115572]